MGSSKKQVKPPAIKKYIQRDANGVPGKVWHSSPKCQLIREDHKVVLANEGMLKAYGITRECAHCIDRDEREAKLDRETDLTEVHELLVTLTPIIAKQVRRDYLRQVLLDAEVGFTLRESKGKLARKCLRVWCRARDFETPRLHVLEARVHWQGRIDANDRHDPYLYPKMRDRCDRALELLDQAEKSLV